MLFSPWSFVDGSIEMFGREYDDLLVVNHCLEFCRVPVFHRNPPGHEPFDAVALYALALYALAELNSIQDLYLVRQYQSL